MLKVFLVTVYLSATGMVPGPEQYMGTTSADLHTCEELARQLGFTARPPEPYIGIGFYCAARTAE